MISEKRDGIKYYQFHKLNHPEITHAIFTRQGGISPEPWDTLNMASLVGDERFRVEENRKKAFRLVGREPASMYDVWQVHSATVVCVDEPRPAHREHIKADAMLTNNPEVTLFMRFADCVPILLFDPVGKVVGLVHAGWRGTVKKISEKSVEVMIKDYGCKAENIRAGIGPSICAEHYAVGSEVVGDVKAAFGQVSEPFLIEQNGVTKLDLWGLNRTLLSGMGLLEIEISALCTASHPEEWFSHRGENGKTGRFGVLIGLNGTDHGLTQR